MDDMFGGDARAQFEVAAKKHGLPLRREAGKYYWGEVQVAWEMWQAALAARQPVEFDRARETPRRQSAVELLLSMGYVWATDHWEARQPAGAAPIAEVSRETFSSDGTSDIIKPNLPIGTKLYAAPPAPAAAPVDHFRDADHLAEWLGSLVAACGQEEWDAAQAAMNGVRAFQNHPDAVERLRTAIEGECDGLAISGQQASAILAYVIFPEPDGFFATHPQPIAAGGDA